MQKTCIVIPCYNEAFRLQGASFLDYADQHPEVYFLFVDDGSVDATAALLSELRNKNPEQFDFISRPQNMGKGASVREGVLKSKQWQTFDFVGFFDADLATPLMEIDWLLEHIKSNPDAGLVFGSRKKTASNTIKRSKARHIMGRIYTVFLAWILRLPIHDTQCGAKIFTAAMAGSVFQKPFLDRWLFDVEIFCRWKQLDHQSAKSGIEEVTLRCWEEKGHSRIRLMDIFTLPLKTVRLMYHYW